MIKLNREQFISALLKGYGSSSQNRIGRPPLMTDTENLIEVKVNRQLENADIQTEILQPIRDGRVTSFKGTTKI